MDTQVAPAADLEAALAREEWVIARARARQVELIREAERLQVPLGQGCRSTTEWMTGRADVAPETAAALVRVARGLGELTGILDALADGEISFDRAAALLRVAVPGDDVDSVLEYADSDVEGIRRAASRRHRLSRHQERQAFHNRYVALQPNLDESSWRLHGELPGYGGKVVEEALTQRADAFPGTPEAMRLTRTQRHADALVAMAQDSLEGTALVQGNGSGPVVTVFVDATEAAPTGAEAGVTVAAGPRVGPDTLQMILCSGAVEVTALTKDGTPLAVGPTARAIPPRLRRAILHRDGGCAVDGCTSRYRLQTHHIRPRSQGGGHHPANLITVCWFHHHVVIHGHCYRIDPKSPPGRIRFLQPLRPRCPP